MEEEKFIAKCKKLVADYTNKNIVRDELTINEYDVYVVWNVKVLQNNKALLATPLPDNMYYEATYNGDKNEIYFDAYKKLENIKVDL